VIQFFLELVTWGKIVWYVIMGKSQRVIKRMMMKKKKKRKRDRIQRIDLFLLLPYLTSP
jgi:hypothetical protein